MKSLCLLCCTERFCQNATYIYNFESGAFGFLPADRSPYPSCDNFCGVFPETFLH